MNLNCYTWKAFKILLKVFLKPSLEIVEEEIKRNYGRAKRKKANERTLEEQETIKDWRTTEVTILVCGWRDELYC